MKRFFVKVLVFAFLITFLMGIIAISDYKIIGSQYQFSYNASLADKIERLEAINEPKIILVGNSNLAFGIDSHRIEESLGMPVVNLGLHGGLGNAFHEEIAKQNINRGDIVIVCHSDFSDSDTISDTELALLTYDYKDSVFQVFRTKDYKDLLKAYPAYLRKSYLLWLLQKGNKKEDSCYSRDAFNMYGDVIYKPEEGQVDAEYFENNASSLPKVSEICANRLNELNLYCIEKGATLVVAGYPIERGAYNKYSIEEYVEFQNELEEYLECPIISNYTDYFYPYEYFYNGPLHLNEIGRQVRTEQLIDDLEKWLKEK